MVTKAPDSYVPSSAHQATLREFVAVLFRRRALVLGLFVVVTVTVVALTLTAPVSYTSSGRVLVYRGERQSALTATRMFYGEWESELGSEVARARSRGDRRGARVGRNGEARR